MSFYVLSSPGTLRSDGLIILSKPCYQMSDSEFEANVSVIPRFTYRKGFSALQNEDHFFPIKSDTHWGCCIRAGQGILAQHILKCIEEHPHHFNSQFGTSSYLRLFNDAPDAPFSIHRICEQIINLGGHEGKWVTVSLLAGAFEQLLTAHGFPVVVVKDGILCVEDVRAKFGAEQSVLILIPLLCGWKEFDMRYCQIVESAVLAYCGDGFISGIKAKARFFVGSSKTQFCFFDPHVTQKCVQSDKDHDRLFGVSLEFMPKEKIKPSILLGYTCADFTEFQALLCAFKSCPYLPFQIVEESPSPNTHIQTTDSWDVIELDDQRNSVNC